jgi:hypothetical protein
MNTVLTRRVMIRGEAVELWESPDTSFDATGHALARYTASGDWVAVFNVLTLQSTPLRAE